MVESVNSRLMPFGKFRGQPVSWVAENHPEYVRWLTDQATFAKQQPDLFALLQKLMGAGDDSPEHNALQVRFLKRDFCEAFLSALSKQVPSRPALRLNEKWGPRFEDLGWDVLLSLQTTQRYFERFVAVEIKPRLGDDFPAVLRQVRAEARWYEPPDRHGRREQRPFIGVLLYEEFSSTSVAIEQVRSVFASRSVFLVSIREI